MKFSYIQICLRSLLVALCAVVNCFALDREAFSFNTYDLNVRLEPEQHRIGVRGKITLRNDTSTPQKIAVLQVSSSLDWRSITVSGKPVQFVRQPFTSDIDHTGSLSEAIVTLPQPVAPHAIVDLEIAYEGVILQDAARLTRIGTPEDIARSSDWDQIDEKFTAVRGAGYVVWYPIATDAANLSEPDSLSDVLQGWKQRSADTRMSVTFQSTQALTLVCSGSTEPAESNDTKLPVFSFHDLRSYVPTFAMGDYKEQELEGGSRILYLPNQQAAAESYGTVLTKLDPLSLAQKSARLQVAEMPGGATPFLTEGLLLMPLRTEVTPPDRLTLVYALARQEVFSSRTWVSEGVAHYAQALDIERQTGRQAALAYLKAHLSLLSEAEVRDPPDRSASQNGRGSTHSLLDMTDDVAMQSKAMWVWWMLRDIVAGNNPDAAVAGILREYKATDDVDPLYVERLFEKTTSRDLKWFFDDWVYNDHGLPDFKVESVYPSKTSQGGYLVTVTVDNLGTAGAEVPVLVKFAGGEMMKRLEVHAKSKTVVRLETPATPEEVTVNDGSVPESDVTNNVFKLQAGK